jgi:hypothetical protein
MASNSPLALDHIIIFLPAKDLDNLPKSFTNAFTITPGGIHADGKTYNKLVILESGVYLEFIAFVDDDVKKREGHWWGTKSPSSIIDWALTSRDVKDVEKLREVGYGEPRRGGRKRGDGKEVEWFVTFPSPGTERGSVPFFCHDVTPRGLRVPEAGISHSSGAISVDHIVIVVATEKLAELIKTYTAIFGASISKHGKAWRLSEPSPVEMIPKGADKGPVVELTEPKSEEDWQIVRKNGGVAGVKELRVFCRGQQGEREKEEVISEGAIEIKLNFVDV